MLFPPTCLFRFAVFWWTDSFFPRHERQENLQHAFVRGAFYADQLPACHAEVVSLSSAMTTSLRVRSPRPGSRLHLLPQLHS
jgi:hypothetical protein